MFYVYSPFMCSINNLDLVSLFGFDQIKVNAQLQLENVILTGGVHTF